MDQSLTLISAQVQFMEERLALVHIPLDIYPFFVSPLLQLLFHEVPPIDRHNADDKEEEEGDFLGDVPPAFLNLSVTPVECSVMCSRKLADLYFQPLVDKFCQTNPSSKTQVSISREDFIAMQVYGEGLDASQRVLELTSPLAMAGISIFFISTYFSDYIVVPLRAKTQVITTLENHGFQFETSTDAFINNAQLQFNNITPHSPRSLTSPTSPPRTPPPSSLAELQARTFASLRKHQIVPSVDPSLRLVQCAAHHRYSHDSSSLSILRRALTTTLLVDQPRFLSLTLTAADPAASLLLEQRLLPRFVDDLGPGSGSDDDTSLLLGSKEDILVPIMLDLRDLPVEATGIICGVASRLAAATHSRNIDEPDLPTLPNGNGKPHLLSHSATAGSNPTGERKLTNGHSLAPSHHLQPEIDPFLDAVEVSFLSTARGGTVIVGERELHRAVDALDAESHEPESHGLEVVDEAA
ncbi:hypothetical protein ASPZODRAFT_139905 [Penicilliopsis zonata CBS 506.65]|uniref:CASTOR ACT domain-containing protein n=1 Tax=Penicilliopsis zonata CBS 506.65 TaxID=1073090 RepID=A0A1L9SPC7_9EURO|nr:hypothetical protein ASPZODRAFT_139905 [Penicilliopsis zonata CBS 506.65]OJJ48953.1 hypothetical protein ASPZODRAFT_139905 [Penicilliopsis zonata CBS 506.65]